MHEFPEVDRAEWFDFDAAMEKIIEAQQGLLRQLTNSLKAYFNLANGSAAPGSADRSTD